MLPDLLRDAGVGLLLLRRTSSNLDVIDANRTAGGLLGTDGQDLRGQVVPRVGVGRLARLNDAVDRAFRGEKSHWCTELDSDRHIDVCISPFDGEPCRLALVQLIHLPDRHEACSDPQTGQ